MHGTVRRDLAKRVEAARPPVIYTGPIQVFPLVQDPERGV